MTQHFRKRRAVSNFPVDGDGDRVYREEDYALPADSIPDEWESGGYLPEEDPLKFAAYPVEDEAFLPDEADAPDEAEWVYDPLAVPADAFAYAEDLLDDEDPLADDLLTDEERDELRRGRWALLSGLADLVGVIVGTAVILVLVALLVSLLNWLMADISQTFTLMQMRF